MYKHCRYALKHRKRIVGQHFPIKDRVSIDERPVCETVVAMLLPYKKHILTITTDNGSEFAEHKLLAKALDTNVFFAHPYCLWEKGLIEYTNKLYRQYIPKGADFNDFSESDIQQIQYKINRRPRKKFAFKTPKQCFYEAIRA